MLRDTVTESRLIAEVTDMSCPCIAVDRSANQLRTMSRFVLLSLVLLTCVIHQYSCLPARYVLLQLSLLLTQNAYTWRIIKPALAALYATDCNLNHLIVV